MKKIVILEDRPENAKAYIGQLRDMNVKVSNILYFYPDKNTVDGKKTIYEEMYQEYGIEIIWVNLWNYEKELDRLYADEDNLFLFDMNLEGDGSRTFENRINVRYVRKKEEKNANKRIWFYTTVSDSLQKLAVEKFEGQVVEVKRIGEQGAILDFEGNPGFLEKIRE